MRKLLVVLMLGLLVACGPEITDNDVLTTAPIEKQSTLEDKMNPGSGTDQQDATIFITLDKEVLQDITEDDLASMTELNGYEGAVLNSDGTATFEMTLGKYDETVISLRNSVDELVKGANDTGTLDTTSIKKVEHDDYETFYFYVNRESYDVDGPDSFLLSFIGAAALQYQTFLNTKPTGENIIMNIVDATTEEIVETYFLPEHMNLFQ